MKKENGQNTEPTYGCITEQGDLGLGFSVLNENDQNAVREQNKKENK